ncbi:MAG: hypothetical protein HF314_17010 [Ignavibacteria bacterium]|jgi:hypothetical protein|nr:hypothetical protein [Ignavibacteria bacterium]MCU7504785.1 hypothetical protein [Ignavibacteria bacterium]MCU7518346.1 hypothetical protein [Ignavibacteria bacterium]
MKIWLILLILPTLSFAQSTTEENMDKAFQNAKKGIYWALSNIPEKKSSVSNDLIADDKLVASVRLEKEIFGIKIESTGVYESTEIKVRLFKSTDKLIQEGYLRPDTSGTKPQAAEVEKTQKVKKTKKKSGR